MLKKMLKKINTKNASAWMAVALSVVLFISGCGSVATNSVEGITIENTEALELTEATESLELTEATEAVEVTETTEAIESTETEMELETEADTESASENEPDKASENASPREAESESEVVKSTYTYTDLNKTMYVKRSVNVRSLPSTDGDKLGSLSSGQSVTITGQCNETGWYRISYNNTIGYCSDNYLTDKKPSNGSSSGSSSGSGGGSSVSDSSSRSSSGSSSSGSSSESSNSGSDSSSTKKAYSVADYIEEVEDKVIELTNKERTAAGLSKLTKNSILVEAAEVRAVEQKGLFGHTRPDGSMFSSAVFDILELRYDDENIENYYCFNSSEIAYKTLALNGMFESESEAVAYFANVIVTAWMDSEGHRAEIMRDDISLAGVGLYVNNGVYCIEMFASDVGYCIDGTEISVE